jgi:hypothetical protein
LGLTENNKKPAAANELLIIDRGYRHRQRERVSLCEIERWQQLDADSTIESDRAQKKNKERREITKNVLSITRPCTATKKRRANERANNVSPTQSGSLALSHSGSYSEIVCMMTHTAPLPDFMLIFDCV